MPAGQTLVSVVMPCYNVAAYVEHAVESLRAQMALEWELVAVDDCSADDTLSILRRMAAEDDRIRVVAMPENGGASKARNEGMAAAKGTHIAFLDPDDAYAETLFSELKSVVDEHDPQVVVWGALERYSNETGEVILEKSMVCKGGVYFEPGEIHTAMLELEKGTLFGYAWNKLYRKDVLERAEASFPSTAINEDFFFNAKVAPCVGLLAVIEKPLYEYSRRAVRQRASLTAQFLPDYFDLSARRVEDMLQLYRGWREDSIQVKQVLGAIYVRYALSALQRNCDPRAGMSSSDRKAWLESFYARPITNDLVDYAAPEGAAARFFAGLFRKRARGQLLFWARVVYLVNRYAPGLFARLRQSR